MALSEFPICVQFNSNLKSIQIFSSVSQKCCKEMLILNPLGFEVDPQVFKKTFESLVHVFPTRTKGAILCLRHTLTKTLFKMNRFPFEGHLQCFSSFLQGPSSKIVNWIRGKWSNTNWLLVRNIELRSLRLFVYFFCQVLSFYLTPNSIYNFWRGTF